MQRAKLIHFLFTHGSVRVPLIFNPKRNREHGLKYLCYFEYPIRFMYVKIKQYKPI